MHDVINELVAKQLSEPIPEKAQVYQQLAVFPITQREAKRKAKARAKNKKAKQSRKANRK